MSQFTHANLRHRAGRYIAVPTGYRAFIPAPLPPIPPVQIQGELQSLLSLVDRALGRLDGSIQTLPNPDLFVEVQNLTGTTFTAANSLVSRLVKLGMN